MLLAYKVTLRSKPTLNLLHLFALLLLCLPSSNAVEILQWGDSSRGGSFAGPTNPPPDLTNAVAVTAGFYHCLALLADGRVHAWGNNTYGQTNVPATLSDVVAFAAGAYHNLAVTADGRVAAWGATGITDEGQTDIPSGLSNVVQVAAGESHSLALLADGTVVSWGRYPSPATLPMFVPTNLDNCLTIASGAWHGLGITAEGNVIAWGANGRTNVPPGLSNVVALAAGRDHTFGLTAHGQLVGFGTGNPSVFSIPSFLTNVQAVASERLWTVALAADGSLVAWGDTALDFGQTNVPTGASNIVMIAAGRYHGLALNDSSSSGYGWRLPHPRLTTNGAVLEFSTQRGRLYVVERNSSLGSSSWKIEERIAGDGSTRRLNVPVQDASFYRVRRVP
ncbi:MAG TPA: hypothetical protein VNT99_00825 [Methylomirabilota bacterium]|nr:hypothetical protein [Methylomirabilota bacterium]